MKSKSTGHWSDRGENLGTFSLKMGKILHPTPYTLHPTPCPHRKTFCRKP
ncbi:MAG: hypothetical protein PX481_10510 [Microcystis sp. M53603_WE2]|nr:MULTISPECIES: hypothetical protein [unclassified Microcystis]MCE2661336.1 hypothetical protein [Microcystis sp. 53602_E8]MDJ0546446.1 hypothetical protein [Microcystis sp. M53601_WE4]MDJ0567040.1 hypothetical protein [Microcystis sp. M49629_WE12]MCE2662407.1 hypothetical protein [Microcystis sp. 53602_E8]MDJ0539113.1 hypothetical protein [Microcystis sp. M53603_WE2]